MAKKYSGRELDSVARVAICVFFKTLPTDTLHAFSLYLESVVFLFNINLVDASSSYKPTIGQIPIS